MIRLDGATATELQRRGIPVRAPWWTSAALRGPRGRGALAATHEAYVRAGADVITANTFRCNLRALRRAGAPLAGRLVRDAVALARAAATRARPTGTVRVAGSMSPVEDCYRPDLVPPDDTMRAEHAWLARRLVAAGVDLVLVETMNSLREARVALAAALEAGAPAYVSLVCGPGALLSGEPLGPAVRALERDGAHAVLVNCAPVAETEGCLRLMRDVAAGPIGAYPNIEDRTGVPAATHVDRCLPVSLTAEAFAGTVARWRTEYGIEVMGGCCGTTPVHLSAAYAALGSGTLTSRPTVP